MTADCVRALLPAGAAAGPALHLFDGPYVEINGVRRELPEGSRRLVVLVALHGGRVERQAAAEALWPLAAEMRAAGNLRSALWRLRGAGMDLVVADRSTVRLVDGIAVDLRAVGEWAARLIEDRATAADLATGAWRSNGLELLPGWHDDWVVVERERLRQRLLHGLEALSRLLVRARRWAEAVEAALAVVAVDPLRESAQRALVEAHLAEGNVVEARRTYERYARMTARELGVRPGAELTALVNGGSVRMVRETAAECLGRSRAG